MSYGYTARTPEEIKQDEINEVKRHVRQCEAALILFDNDTAIAIKIAMGGNNFFELWISENSRVRTLIENEKNEHLQELFKLETK